MAINEWAVLVRHATESGKQRTLLAVDVAQVEATAGLNLYTTPWKVLRGVQVEDLGGCLLYTSPSPRDVEEARMPSSA